MCKKRVGVKCDPIFPNPHRTQKIEKIGIVNSIRISKYFPIKYFKAQVDA